MVRTRGIDHTISFLQSTHRLITKRFYEGKCAYSYENNTLIDVNNNNSKLTTGHKTNKTMNENEMNVTYQSNQSSFDKEGGYLTFTEYQNLFGRREITHVGDAFLLMLRAIPNCSVAAANAIADKYKR